MAAGDNFNYKVNGISIEYSTVLNLTDDLLNFTLTGQDADGDTTTDTLSITLEDPNLFIVGSNANDTAGGASGSDDSHIVPNGPLGTDGVITGGDGDDTIFGDPGSAVFTPGQTANVVLVLDTSASMDWELGDDSNPEAGESSRIELLQAAINQLLNTLDDSGAQNMRVKIIGFDETSYNVGSGAYSNGVYDLIQNGVVNTAALNAAIAAINGLDTEIGTNYEAALASTDTWIDTPQGSGGPLSGADVNKVLFVSDGQPTSYLDSDGDPQTGNDTGDGQRHHCAQASARYYRRQQ